MNFPRKLHDLLTQASRNGYDSTVSWAPDGKCFCIYNRDDFVANILPVWFKQTKWTSFQRQLNIYKFRRVEKGGSLVYYAHEYFVRDSMHLLYSIERIPLVKIAAKSHKTEGCADWLQERLHVQPFDDRMKNNMLDLEKSTTLMHRSTVCESSLNKKIETIKSGNEKSFNFQNFEKDNNIGVNAHVRCNTSYCEPFGMHLINNHKMQTHITDIDIDYKRYNDAIYRENLLLDYNVSNHLCHTRPQSDEQVRGIILKECVSNHQMTSPQALDPYYFNRLNEKSQEMMQDVLSFIFKSATGNHAAPFMRGNQTNL